MWRCNVNAYENFPNLEVETDIQVRKHRVPNRIQTKDNTPKHTISKMANIKYIKRILKASREMEQVTKKGSPIKLSANFSAELCKPDESGIIQLKWWKIIT